MCVGQVNADCNTIGQLRSPDCFMTNKDVFPVTSEKHALMMTRSFGGRIKIPVNHSILDGALVTKVMEVYIWLF